MLSSSSSLLEELDELDLCILLLLLHTLEGELLVLRANLIAAWDRIRKEEFTAKRAKPNVARRQSFDQFIQVLSPIHFRRMFRMNRCSFDRLCECVISKVGESTFKSQEWLLSHEATKPSTYNATNALGGVLSEEVKIAIMLRIMAGASYLDVLFVYGISTATVYSVFHKAAAWMPSTF